MKLFLDTADTELIEKHFQTDLIDGITTNPTLIMKSGRDPEEVYQQLIDMGIDDISMEVVGDFDEMYMEGLRLSRKFGKNATIKVPCTPAGLKVCKKLSRDLVNVNVTLIFSPAQAILAAKAGATYVSPFVGRVDDNGFDGIQLISDISKVFKQHKVETQILAASIRNVKDVGKCFEVGADICTIPPSIFDKMYKHVLTDKGLEQFDKDWESLQSKLI